MEVKESVWKIAFLNMQVAQALRGRTFRIIERSIVKQFYAQETVLLHGFKYCLINKRHT